MTSHLPEGKTSIRSLCARARDSDGSRPRGGGGPPGAAPGPGRLWTRPEGPEPPRSAWPLSQTRACSARAEHGLARRDASPRLGSCSSSRGLGRVNSVRHFLHCHERRERHLSQSSARGRRPLTPQQSSEFQRRGPRPTGNDGSCHLSAMLQSPVSDVDTVVARRLRTTVSSAGESRGREAVAVGSSGSSGAGGAPGRRGG